MYQKEIVYMNLFENDIKSNCAGYLKLEKVQGNYRIELQVKNLPRKYAGSFPIRLQGENDWNEAGMLIIKDGCGKWMETIKEPIMRAEVILSDASRIKGESKNAQSGEAVMEPPIDHNSQSKEDQSPALEDAKLEPPIIKAEKIIEVNNTSTYEKEAKPSPNQESTPLYESKWEQLLSTYEQIHPYGDNRVYVKLEPKDFIVLRSNYQHLVNNSFLLHGFYNYRYVILGKERDFYIGVPGVFYEREKMVALMFGFEAFECEGGDAEEGKFGYYLRKVEI